jgi:hypothetical protein
MAAKLSDHAERLSAASLELRDAVLNVQLEHRLLVPEMVQILCTLVSFTQEREAWDHLVRECEDLRRSRRPKKPDGPCDCCDRHDEYNGYGSGPLLFRCPKNCSCHD